MPRKKRKQEPEECPFSPGDLVDGMVPIKRRFKGQLGVITSVMYVESEWFAYITLQDGTEVYTYCGFLTKVE